MVAVAPEALGLALLPYVAAFSAILVASLLLAPRRLDEKKKGERAYYASSVMSLVHGTTVSALSFGAGLQSELWPLSWSTPWDFHLTTDTTHACINMFVAFLLVDLVPLFYYRRVWSSTGMYIGHHVCSIVSWSTCALTGTCHCVALALLLTEATAPFTNGRYFLSTAGHKDSTLYALNGVLMAISFFLLRVLGMGLIGVRVFIVERERFFALHPAQTSMLV